MRKSLLFIMCAVCYLLPHITEAAVLSLSTNAEATVGSVVRVSVLLSSPSQSVNAVSGTISFPKDKLQIISISKDGSIINLWATDPTFSNAQGTASFEGVILNSFNGSGGKVATLVFKVISIGDAPVVFSSASVLASDGAGTNVLTSTSNKTLFLTSGISPKQITNKEPEPKVVEEKPLDIVPVSPPVFESNPEKPKVVVVGILDIVQKYRELGIKLVDAFSITIALGSLIFTFLCIVWYTRLRVAQIRKRVKRELGIVDYSMHKALSQLHAEVTSHVNNIKKAKTKRELTAEEAVFMDRFEHRLSHIESMLNSEMDRIDKDIHKI